MTARLTLLALLLLLAPGQSEAEMRAGAFEDPVGSMRGTDFNRTFVAGQKAGSSAAGVANSVTVSQSGKGNTLYLVIDQHNSGDLVAGVTLNGELTLD